MPAKFGTFGINPIYNGEHKIGKIYKGLDLVYQSMVITPVIALIERTIKNVDTELTNEVINIRSYAFAGCTELQSITIPESVKSLGAYTFLNCSKLNNIIIPSGVSSLSNGLFQNCSSLTTMTVLATSPPTIGETTPFSTATTTIYVPSGSLTAYQTAEKWADLTTRETNPVTFVGI